MAPSAMITSALTLLGAVTCATAFPAEAYAGHSQFIPRQTSYAGPENQTYDYIIAGGGLTGLVVANRLTEDPSINVLVIEWGTFDRSPAATVPYNGNNLNFASMKPTTSAPDANLNGATFQVLIGGVVGGGTVVNGEAYNRASAGDYDAWEQLGNPGWGFNDLLPYFRKSTTFQAPNAGVVEEYGLTYNTAAYGQGPAQVSLSNFQFPDIKKFWQAWKDSNVPIINESGLGDAAGAFWMPSTVDQKNGIRSDAQVKYYAPVANRPNLHLVTQSTVNEVLFGNGLTARGVSYSRNSDDATFHAYAKREVILAAGAINTPRILQLSGIGPKSVVEAARITNKVNLPGVGANFQDHPVSYLNFNLSGQATPNSNTLAIDPGYNASQLAQYAANKTGIYSSARGNGVAFLSLPDVTNNSASISQKVAAQNAAQYLPSAYNDSTLLQGFMQQRQILAQRYGSRDTSVSEYPFSGGSGAIAAAFQKPLSRGTITLDPANPQGQPIIQYNTIQNPIDSEIVLAIVRRARSYFASGALESLSPVETVPGAQFQTDNDLLAGLKAGSLNPSFAHPSGSCAMMPRNLGGCVNTKLQVYGTQNLRVIDTSIIPLIPGAHLQATMYAVAEKAADLIKST